MRECRLWSIVIGLVALLLFRWATTPTTYRYRLTVEVATPKGCKARRFGK